MHFKALQDYIKILFLLVVAVSVLVIVFRNSRRSQDEPSLEVVIEMMERHDGDRDQNDIEDDK